MPDKKVKPIIAVDLVSGEILEEPKPKKETVAYGKKDAIAAAKKKKTATDIGIGELMKMDEKIWSELDYMKGKINQLEDMVRRIQGRLGLE